jgi:hypothetical protein
MANASSSAGLTVSTPPRLIPSPVTNHPGSQLARDGGGESTAACQDRLRTRLPAPPAHARSDGTRPQPADADRDKMVSQPTPTGLIWLRLHTASLGQPLFGIGRFGRRMHVLLLVLAGVVTHGAPARYAVSAAPFNVGNSGNLCIAIDATDPHGIWWWESGTDSCATRDTGPGLIKADEATVSSDRVEVHGSFRLPLHGVPPHPDHLDVRLVIARGRMRSASGNDVPVVYRADLNIPARLGR